VAATIGTTLYDTWELDSIHLFDTTLQHTLIPAMKIDRTVKTTVFVWQIEAARGMQLLTDCITQDMDFCFGAW
jgi:hypothetical protein